MQRDDIGIGGSWSEFMDYVTASLRSRDVKLIFDGHSTSDGDYPACFVYLQQGSLVC